MKKSRDNRGYSLVEMIIVLAIVAIVATMALISITLIHSAKAKEAAVTVDEEVATLITKSKNMKCEHSDWENAQFAARIYADNEGVYYFQKGYYNPDTYEYDFTNTDDNGEGKGKSLSSYVQIKFTTSNYYFVGYHSGVFKEDDPNREYASFTLTNQDVSQLNHGGLSSDQKGGGIFIRFNKDGTCATGYGDIIFCKRNGNEVAHEYIRVNGSHQCK